jgi:hypothetical protein
MARDSMSPEQREAHDRVYGIARTALEHTGPMVVSINGAVASVAVTEYMALVTGLREPLAHLNYRADQQVIRKSLDPPDPGCYYRTSIWGHQGLTGRPPAALPLSRDLDTDIAGEVEQGLREPGAQLGELKAR